MSRRTPETLADYVVVGIAPALIMLLIGSLVFFLIGVFYQGEFPYRLTWVMGLFVLATVCVARISMEEGASYAALFGIPLGVVVGIAVVYFVQIEGPLAPFSAFINWGLLALIWWCAHQLTWDCTLIDNRRDTTGQGLLQSMGWDSPTADDNDASIASTQEQNSEEDRPQQHPWWQRLFQHHDQPAAHGRWVVYFSVAALPLFGLGQFFIPVADAAGRRYAFWMLVIYVGSALGLLLTTSFLGLRRYIRQRQLEMPVEMTATWLGVGVAMIVGLLIAAALLPRPAPEYSIAEAVQARVGRFTSPDRDASRFGVGPEGSKSDEQGQAKSDNSAGKAADDEKSSDGKRPGGSAEGSQSESPGSSTNQDPAKAGEAQEDQRPGEGAQGDSGTSSADGQSAGSADKSGGSASSQENQESQAQPTSDPSGGKSGKADSSGQQPRQEQNSGTQQSASTSQNDSNSSVQSGQSPTQSSGSSPPIVSQITSNLGNLLRWAFYAAVAIIGAILAWKYRRELAAAWQQFLKELSELWQRLFGGKTISEAPQGTTEVALPAKSFRDFPDPFTTGHAQRMAMPQLVQYSFEALQAWGRDFAVHRENGQTPHEFSEAVGQHQPSIDVPGRQLAEIYSRMAYARQAPPAQTATILQSLWQAMNDVARRPLTSGTADRPVGSV